jgi:outer membrane protein assembly factor BamB
MTDLSETRREFLTITAGSVLGAGLAANPVDAVQSGADSLTVYVGALDGTLYAVDAASGEQTWSFSEPAGPVDSSPTVVDGTVYVGSDDGTLYAVDAASGEQTWTFGGPSDAVDSSPTIVDGTVYVGSDDGTLYAVDAESGDQEWMFTEPPEEVNSSPTVKDGTVYVGGVDTLYAVDASSGQLEWGFYEPADVVVSSPTIVDNTVYIGSNDATLYAVAADSGDQRWAFDKPTDAVASAPTVVDGTVYVGSEDDSLYAVDAASGDQEWAYTTPAGSVFSSPAVANGIVYVGSLDNSLYAVDAEYGTQEWAFTRPGGVVASSPTVVEETVYVASYDQSLYAVDAESGSQEWEFTGASDRIFASPTVVKNPEDGDSIGSRVLHGTLGHHDDLKSGTKLTLTPSFDVSIADANTPPSGEELTVTVDIENSSDVPDTQTVTLSISGLGEDQVDVSLDGGESTTETLSVGTTDGDADDYTATVESETDSVSQEVTVLASAIFSVSIVDVTEPSPGADIEVTVDVQNTGGASDTQTVTVTVTDIGSVQRELSLDGNESTTETFSIGTSEDEYGEHQVVVESEDDTVEGVALAAPLFTVDVTDVVEPVAGESVEVTVEVANIGNRSESQTLSLSIPELGDDQRELSLVGKDSTTETFSIGTSEDDVGEYTVTVESEDDTATADVRVLAPARFEVDVVEVSEPVAGDPLEVAVNVENTGGVTATQTVSLSVPDLEESQRDISLDGGESTTETFSVETGEADAGEYTATVESENDSASQDLRVLAPATFVVEVVEVTESTAGESLELTVAVENTGSTEGTQTVTLSVSDLGERQRDITLGGGESTTETFSVETGEADAGEYTATVASASDEQSVSITVPEPADAETPTTTPTPGSSSSESDDGFDPTSIVTREVGLGLGAVGTATVVGGIVYQYLRDSGGPPITTELGNTAWTQRGRTHQRTAADATVPAPEREPEIAWSTETPVREIAVGGGVVINVTDRQLIGRTLKNGAEQWIVEFVGQDGIEPDGGRTHGQGPATVTAPAIADRTVVLAVDGVLRAFDLGQGHQLWQQMLPSQPSAPPLIVENTCYVATAETVHALDVGDGFQQWECNLAGTATLAATTNRLFAAGQDVVCLDPADGSERWRTDHDCGRGSELACDGGDVVVSGTEGISCFDAATGTNNWTADVQSDIPGVALTADRVYLTTRGGVTALSRDAGSQVWVQPLDATTQPTCIGGAVYVGTPLGLVALNAREGTQYWAQELMGQTRKRPIVVGNGILVQTSAGSTAIAGEMVEAPGEAPSQERSTIQPQQTQQGVPGQAPPQSQPGPEQRTPGQTSRQPQPGPGEGSPGQTPPPTGPGGGEGSPGQTPPPTGPGEGPPGESPQPSQPTSRASLDTVESLSDLTQLSEDGPLVTYEATHEDVDDRVRVVALAEDIVSTDAVEDAFRQTAQGWRNGSSHPGVCSIHEWGLDPRPWIAIGSVDGTRLTECMTTLSDDEVVNVIADVADAVRNVALYNVHHLNLRPESIWVVDDGEGVTAVVEDWGLTRAVREALGDQHVTPYTAPEQLDGGPVDERTDVYGLAGVTYHALTGELPVLSDVDAIQAGDIDPPSEVSGVPTQLDETLMRGLATDPAQRHASPLDFSRALSTAW